MFKQDWCHAYRNCPSSNNSTDGNMSEGCGVVIHSTVTDLASCCAVGGAEDPEKILDQAVNEMQSDLIKMRQSSAQVNACLDLAQGQARCVGFCSLSSSSQNL